MKGIVYDENRYKNHIKPDLGDQTPEELNPLDLDRIRINLLKKKKLSPQTAKHVMALIRRLVNFGVRKGLCKGLDFPITMPSVNNERTEDLNPNELSRLLKALDKTEDVQIANLMRLILHTGMRKSEALRLKWEDIDFRTGFIHLRDRKAGGDTRIPMNDQARTVLKAHPRQSEWVFPGRGGNGPRKDVKRAVAKVKEEAGLPEGFRPLHGLRHFFASTLASNGIDLFTIQRLLGHRSAGTTARYSHLRDAAVCDASSLAGSLIEAQAAEGKEKEKKKKSKSRQTAG